MLNRVLLVDTACSNGRINSVRVSKSKSPQSAVRKDRKWWLNVLGAAIRHFEQYHCTVENVVHGEVQSKGYTKQPKYC